MKVLVGVMMVASFLSADFIGGEVQVGMVQSSPDMSVSSSDISLTDKDVGFGQTGDFYASAYIEHPIPIIPNIRVSGIKTNKTGTETFTKDFEFIGKTFSISEEVKTEYLLSEYDGTLYYELLDNWINIDVGVTARYLVGELSMSSNSISEKQNIETIIPMIYGMTQVDIPFSDLSFKAEGNYINYEDDTVYDYEVGVRYDLGLISGVELGYKVKFKDISVDGVRITNNFNGAYGKVYFDF